MKIRVASGLAMAAFCAGASAYNSEPDVYMLVRNAARLGHAVSGLSYGQPSVAVPVRGDSGCANIGVLQPGTKRKFSGGPRIANYRVCQGEISEVDDVSPELPSDTQFKQVVIMTVKGAARYGGQPNEWGGYHIEARRLSMPDMNGCAQVETVISTEGMLVSYNTGLICP